MAYPRGRADAPRYERLTFRLAEDEVIAVTKAAAAQGVTVGEFVRGTAISASATYLPNAATTAGAAVKK